MIKDIIPVVVTAIIAIVGYFFQFLYFVVERRQQITDTRLASIGQYYFDLMRLLTILQNSIFGLDDISNKLFDASQDVANNSSKTPYDDVFKVYQEIENISSSGKYLFINKKIHKLLMELSGHIVSINYSMNKRLSEEQLRNLKEIYPLPNITLIMNLINKALR